MIRSLTGAALLLWAGSLLAQALPASVTQALAAAHIPTTAVAVVVQPLDAPRPLLAHNAQKAMNPASVMKLVTTYAALEILGPAATWQTGAWATAEPDAEGRLSGHLYLKGSGDPKLTLENFTALLRQLRVRGIRHIDGDLVLDRSVFELPPFDPAAFDNKPLRAYNVGPDGLLLDYRALRFTLKPEGEQVRFWSETPSAGLQVEGRLTPATGPCDGWRDRLEMRQSPGRLEISGPYPVSCGERSLYLSPLAAEPHAEGLFRALWQELGESIQGRVRSGRTPPQARLLASQESPPLSEVVRDINKWSNNVMARQLFLTLGSGEGQPSTVARARERLNRWLAAKGLEFPELVLENGSGLSRVEQISAAHLNRLLLAAWQSPVMPEFMASLPLAGVDGTMKRRLTDSAATGRAHIKTGSLDKVKAMAGYVLDAQGRRHAVTFIINHPQADMGQPALDALLLWVSQSPSAR